jgi:xanthine dehydrogenase small subunit
MNSKPIRFIRRGELVTLVNVPPTRTLLQVLREDLNGTGTKEGCNEGDCGACTVVLGEKSGNQIKYSAVNSCIRLAHSIDGMALWTVEDIAPTLHRSRGSLPPEGARFASGRPSGETSAPILHPAQQAMVDCHGSQCGFCTPGFVMSLFGMYQNRVCQGQPITRQQAQEDLSGNLCRCTGYRPILDAAQAMAALPVVAINEAELLQKLKQTIDKGRGLETHLTYISPKTLPELLQLRAAHSEAQIVAGCTDVGLWVNKMHMDFAQVLDVTQVRELRRVETYRHHIAIGAAVSLTDAFAALIKDRPQLHTFATRFAGLPVRNSGTLGGNVANGSPIGDSMPLLIALGANVVLISQRGHREMRLEDFYTGYRKNVLAADEVLAWIKVPKPVAGEFLRVYKISKRFDDDISAVCLALNIHIKNGQVASGSIGAGGVAATPVRALKTEAALRGQPWSLEVVQEAQATLQAEFQPISDMRASAAYRTHVLGSLVQRFWLESQGLQQINLESFTLEGEPA